MSTVEATLSALANLILLVGLPFSLYYAYHRWRKGRRFGEVVQRTGLQTGDTRYIGYCALFAAVLVSILSLWPPTLDYLVVEGSSWTPFVGRGVSGASVFMALLYGVVKTGFAEEFLFRGLIAGSLSRRLPLTWANLLQATIFLLPHLLILKIMPEAWGFLPLVFAGSLFVGWIRIKSGSIVGPWLVHASVNVAMALSVAIRTAA